MSRLCFLAALRHLPALAPAALVAALLLPLALPAQAQWKWRDAAGQIHISDRPPPREVPDKSILQRPGPPARAVEKAPVDTTGSTAAPSGTATTAPAPVPANQPKADPELEARRKKAEAEAAAKAKAEEEKVTAQRAENCKRARIQLTTLESGQRIARANEKGEREFLDDKARQAEMQAARQVVSSDCR